MDKQPEVGNRSESFDGLIKMDFSCDEVPCWRTVIIIIIIIISPGTKCWELMGWRVVCPSVRKYLQLLL